MRPFFEAAYRGFRLAALALVTMTAAFGTFAAPPVIHGAGATFPMPVLAAWGAEYLHARGVELHYEPVGSGAGIEQVESRQADFGATEAPLPAAELQRKGLLQFPAVIGAVVLVVNIAGIKSGDLRLSGEVLAEIYLGRIRKWNAAAIAALNPGLSLPDSYITVVHRSDASGTSLLWSEFLARSNPEWRRSVGAGMLPAWPTGVSDAGNEGVASSVQRTRMSIGYVEYAYARQHRLSLVSLRNREGWFVSPGRAAFEAAALTARWSSLEDTALLLADPPGAGSWPIVGASFILLPADAGERSAAVIRFFDWGLNQGRHAAEDLGYVPLPDAAVELVQKAWSQIR